MSTLPPGVKTVRQIRKQADPIQRVHEAKRLLEYVLNDMVPNLRRSDGSQAYIGDRVQHLRRHFSSISNVMFAIGVRNKLDHPRADDMPRADEIRRAGEHLLRAIEDILPHAPQSLASLLRQKRSSRKAPRAAAPPRQHPCGQCGRRFQTRRARAQHARDAHRRRPVAPAVPQPPPFFTRFWRFLFAPR